MRWVVDTTLRPLYPQESPGTHCIAGWVDHRVGLEGCEKYRPPSGFDRWTVQTTASRNTDCAIHAHFTHRVVSEYEVRRATKPVRRREDIISLWIRKTN